MATTLETRETATRALEPEQRIVIRNVGWEGYERLLEIVGDGQVRLAFDGRDVELMSPSQDHEFNKNILGILILTVAEVLKIPCRGYASTTWRKKAKERGLEPDLCYYSVNAHKVRGKKGKIDLANDPPPDLAIDRLGIYAALGVQEVWRYDGERLSIEVLQPDGFYTNVAASPSLPAITPEEVVHWVRLADDMEDDVDFVIQLRQWVREVLLPRHQAH